MCPWVELILKIIIILLIIFLGFIKSNKEMLQTAHSRANTGVVYFRVHDRFTHLPPVWDMLLSLALTTYRRGF